MVASIINSGYDADKFSLSLSIPICLSLRQRSLLVHLASCMAGMEQEDIVPIKKGT